MSDPITITLTINVDELGETNTKRLKVLLLSAILTAEEEALAMQETYPLVSVDPTSERKEWVKVKGALDKLYRVVKDEINTTLNGAQ